MLGLRNIRQKVGESSEPGCIKGATLESFFPPLPVHGYDGPGPLGPHPW